MAFGFEAYVRYHHVFTHNLLFGALVTLSSAIWIGARAGPLGLVFAAFLSHLVGDYFGSGPGYGLWPLLPFLDAYFACPCGWPVVWWINLVATVGVIALALAIATRYGRTPLEFVHAGLERAVVSKLRLAPCHSCPRGAALRCQRCGRPVCRGHVARWTRLRPVCQECGG